MIINRRLSIAMMLLIFASCQPKEEEQSKTNQQVLSEVVEVKAIGKVVPIEDLAIIASQASDIIKKVLINEGDSVTVGQLLIELDPGTSFYNVDDAKAKLTTQQANNLSLKDDLKKAQILLDELYNKYETSNRLLLKNAETKEQVATDYSAWKQQQSVIASLQKQIRAQQIAENELRIQVRKTEAQQTDFQILASKSGVITDLSAKIGQSVNAVEELGKIINPNNPNIEAEVDELFADKVAVGQLVYVFAAGRADTLAQGNIAYVSPILSNKSILYEIPNEGEDRRVRRIKINLIGENKLIINAKVDCTIKIK